MQLVHIGAVETRKAERQKWPWYQLGVMKEMLILQNEFPTVGERKLTVSLEPIKKSSMCGSVIPYVHLVAKMAHWRGNI